MKKPILKMLSKFIEELQIILEDRGDMPVAVKDIDGECYTSDIFYYPQEYYYDGGYVFPVDEEESEYHYENYESSRSEGGRNPKLKYDTVLKIMGNSPELDDTLDGIIVTY